jgi:shikimate kinase
MRIEDRGARSEERGASGERFPGGEANTPALHVDPRSSILDPRTSIFLVGYRATGKSTVARLLAERLGWAWVDADEVLERRHGRTIRQIFAEEGEAGFRDKEAAIVEALCRGQRLVVATGGGVVLRPENRQRLRAAGRVVWLTADAQTIWERLQRDPTTGERRPALTVGGLAEVEELLRVREPHYRECAEVTVDTRGRSPEDIVAEILNRGSRIEDRG